MRHLAQIVEEPAWPKIRAEYEQGIVNEFATTAMRDIYRLHDRLIAARDFLDHLEREAKHVET